ncbi:hypothetical protein QVD17_21072 [Tagetes erecta]|uniref:Transmembrane protein n=1 Tax=Tagetes erecta TaxID=13708 RepID=A0AAD8NYK4_TARER|nr:hypothetical protein QVD17_21072 [Tagetes erecta]
MVSRQIIYMVFLILLLLLSSIVLEAKAIRLSKGDADHHGLSSMLPRGIVPPSGPSPCHNILDRKRTHHPPLAFPPPFAPPFVPPFAPPFSPQFQLPFVDPPPPPPDEIIICP